MKRLVLFDIDGTLLSAGGAGARAVYAAMREVYGQTGITAGYNLGGRTDPQIVRELLVPAGFSVQEVEEGLNALWDAYLRNLREELQKARIRPMPGVPQLLDRLEASGDPTVLGLLTGNVEEGARLKVDAAGLGFDRFRVGAYGSDHWQRPELPAVAARRAKEKTGIGFEGKEIVIIGDTPFDISCGAHMGVRTIATATGTHTAADLAAHGPDYLFDDLSDVDAVWRAIME